MVFARGHMSSLKFYAVLFSRGEGDVPCLGFNEGISWTKCRLCTSTCMYVGTGYALLNFFANGSE